MASDSTTAIIGKRTDSAMRRLQRDRCHEAVAPVMSMPELLGCGVAGGEGPGHPPPMQDDDPIGQRQQFVEVHRCVHDGRTVVAP